MSKDKILVIEDDPAIARGLLHNLSYEGFDVRNASHGQAALPMIAEFSPDLIVLDLMLPGMSGFDILKALRERDDETYVIILSARTDESDKVRGLSMGADDYVAKPFGLREFLARIAAAMRRIHKQRDTESQELVFGNLRILPSDRTIFKDDSPLKLTPKAAELLVFFARHPHHAYSREALIAHIWGDDYDGTPRTIDNFIVQIRAQIEPNSAKPQRLETVHGLGYRFNG